MPDLSPDAEFRDLAVRLKLADEALVPLVRRNIRVATEPLSGEIRKSALAMLPKSGGANEWVAGSQISTKTTFIPKTAGVTIRMHAKNSAVSTKRARARAAGKRYQSSPSHNLVAINKGTLRHPRFGDRDEWFNTQVPRGFFDKPVFKAQPAVVAAGLAAIREAAAIAGFR